MPNGIDKNWMRMCAAVNGFRARYQRWPVRVRLPVNAISGLFTPKSLAKIEEKLTLVEDGSPLHRRRRYRRTATTTAKKAAAQ